jgi:hypothetical protein
MAHLLATSLVFLLPSNQRSLDKGFGALAADAVQRLGGAHAI